MDRLNTHLSNENQLKSELFEQLFLFRTELEKYEREGFQYRAEIQTIIFKIDELVGILIDEVESNRLE